MRKLHLSLLAMLTIAMGLIAPTTAGAATTAWNDGFADQDTIIDCITSKPSVGVSGNVGWSSPTGEVPRVGEKFYIRGYVGLVSLPCSGKVAILPELLAPAGLEYVDEDVRWDVYKTGEQPALGTGGLIFDHGNNGGILMAPEGTTAFTLRQGDILEFQFPVKATREMKGPATQQPTCQSRLDGDAPCPIAQAGDHFQMAYTVTGHGGDKYYVTPFVGLFAATPTTTTPTPNPGPNPNPNPTPTPTPAPAPGPNPNPAPVPAPSKAASTTKATWKPSATRRGKVSVVVSSTATPTGTVVIRDGRRSIAKAVLKASNNGRVVISLPKLGKGKHVLKATYTGSTTTAASATKRTVTLR